MDPSPVQIPTFRSFYFVILGNPEQRKLEFFAHLYCWIFVVSEILLLDWHLIKSHLVEHFIFKAEFIQICFQFSADFIQPSFHLFCDVAITWSVSINRTLLSQLFFDLPVTLRFTCRYDLHFGCTCLYDLRSWAEDETVV